MGCVIEKSDHAGGDDRPLLRNIENMQKFPQEIIDLDKEFGQHHAAARAQEEAVDWTSQQWTAWHGVQNAAPSSATGPKECNAARTWEAAKTKLEARRADPTSPVAQRFAALHTPDIDKAKRVEEVD